MHSTLKVTAQFWQGKLLLRGMVRLILFFRTVIGVISFIAALAQLVERILGKNEVVSSILTGGSKHNVRSYAVTRKQCLQKK